MSAELIILAAGILAMAALLFILLLRIDRRMSRHCLCYRIHPSDRRQGAHCRFCHRLGRCGCRRKRK